MTSQISSEIVVSGLNRFFSEGYCVWSKEKFKSLLESDPKISEESFINDLVNRGLIRFVGTEDEYVVVIKEIE